MAAAAPRPRGRAPPAPRPRRHGAARRRGGGLPRTEVGRLRRRDGSRGGAPLAPGDRLAPGDVVEVEPLPRPQTLPAGGLLLDVHLGALARRLRLLGLDATDDPALDDAGLVERAREQDRLLLTRDRGLLRRRALPRGALVRSEHPDRQAREVLDRFAPSLAPRTRCTACGGPLEPVARTEVAGRLLAGTLRTYDAFTRCTRCDQVFWRGAHSRGVEELLRRAGAGG